MEFQGDVSKKMPNLFSKLPFLLCNFFSVHMIARALPVIGLTKKFRGPLYCVQCKIALYYFSSGYGFFTMIYKISHGFSTMTGLAQSVEGLTAEQEVVGMIPTAGPILRT